MSEPDLHSWKEIADYLHVTVRCAQRWEQERGMPVRRLPGGRGRVSAAKADLAAWQAGIAAVPAVDEPHTAVRPGPTWRLLAWIAACGFVVVVLLAAARRWSRDGVPVMVRIDHHVLIACDNLGKELWRYAFAKPLDPTSASGQNADYLSWFGDIDGDGASEILYSRIYDPARDSAALICFSSKGVVKWEFMPGRTVASPRQSFPPPYSIASFRVFRARESDAFSILVVAFNQPDYATQVTLLSPEGLIIREYWHSGYIGQWMNVEIADLNHDGLKEIYLGGVNNGYRQATLVVLDPMQFGGASVEENPEYQILGFSPGREVARVLFPKGCIAKTVSALYNSTVRVAAQSDGLLFVEVEERPDLGERIQYRFGPELRLHSTRMSDTIWRMHAALRAQGIIDHEFAPKQEEAAFAALRNLPCGMLLRHVVPAEHSAP